MSKQKDRDAGPYEALAQAQAKFGLAQEKYEREVERGRKAIEKAQRRAEKWVTKAQERVERRSAALAQAQARVIALSQPHHPDETVQVLAEIEDQATLSTNGTGPEGIVTAETLETNPE